MNKIDGAPAFTFLIIGLIALIAMDGLPFGTFREPGTAFFPVLLSLLLIFLSLLLSIRALKRKLTKPVEILGEHWKKLIPALAGLIVYALVMRPVGYVISTFLLLILFARVEKCTWKVTLLVSFLCTVGSYVVFRWYLQSPLPQGIIPF